MAVGDQGDSAVHEQRPDPGQYGARPRGHLVQGLAGMSAYARVTLADLAIDGRRRAVRVTELPPADRSGS